MSRPCPGLAVSSIAWASWGERPLEETQNSRSASAWRSRNRNPDCSMMAAASLLPDIIDADWVMPVQMSPYLRPSRQSLAR